MIVDSVAPNFSSLKDVSPIHTSLRSILRHPIPLRMYECEGEENLSALEVILMFEGRRNGNSVVENAEEYWREIKNIHY